MKLNWIKQTPVRLPKAYLAQKCHRMQRLLKKQGVKNADLLTRELTLVFVNRAQMRQIHRDYRKKDKVTDVLSFESMDPESMGELIFCPEVVAGQARKHDLSHRDELLYLTLHGVLHLLGYDHEKGGRQEKIMMALQDRIFEQL